MTTQQDAPALTLGAGLALWAAVVAAVAGFVVIGSLLKLAPLYAGFLFAWYWASMDKVAFQLAPATVIGAACGIATAGLAQYAALHWGLAGGLAVLALIALALLVQIMNWLPLAINPAYMLFLTVTGAPLLQQGEDFRAVVAALGLAAIYFCGITYLGLRVFALIRRAPAVVAPEV
jgi:hypothetical protein